MRVFISYKRHLEPDEPLAELLHRALTDTGHSVFLDQTIDPGRRWADEIERHIVEADLFLVLLTEAATRSEWITAEVDLARRQADASRTPRIVPIRLNFGGDLPYTLKGRIGALQYMTWRGDHDTPALVGSLSALLAGQPLPEPSPPPASVPPSVASHAPAFSAPPPPGGGAALDDPWYLERPIDRRGVSLIGGAGTTIAIEGPRQMGKTSLLFRLLAASSAAGKQVAYLTLEPFDAATLASADLFYRAFARALAVELELPDHLDQHWQGSLPNAVACTQYVETQILKPMGGNVALGLDEVDTLVSSPFPQRLLRHAPLLAPAPQQLPEEEGVAAAGPVPGHLH